MSSQFLAWTNWFFNGLCRWSAKIPDGKFRSDWGLTFIKKKKKKYQKRIRQVQLNQIPRWRWRIAKIVISTFASRKFRLKIVKFSFVWAKVALPFDSDRYFRNFWVNGHLMSFYEIWYIDLAKWVSNKMCLWYDWINFASFLEKFSHLLQSTADMLRKCSEMIKRSWDNTWTFWEFYESSQNS